MAEVLLRRLVSVLNTHTSTIGKSSKPDHESAVTETGSTPPPPSDISSPLASSTAPVVDTGSKRPVRKRRAAKSENSTKRPPAAASKRQPRAKKPISPPDLSGGESASDEEEKAASNSESESDDGEEEEEDESDNELDGEDKENKKRKRRPKKKQKTKAKSGQTPKLKTEKKPPTPVPTKSRLLCSSDGCTGLSQKAWLIGGFCTKHGPKLCDSEFCPRQFDLALSSPKPHLCVVCRDPELLDIPSWGGVGLRLTLSEHASKTSSYRPHQLHKLCSAPSGSFSSLDIRSQIRQRGYRTTIPLVAAVKQPTVSILHRKRVPLSSDEILQRKIAAELHRVTEFDSKQAEKLPAISQPTSHMMPLQFDSTRYIQPIDYSLPNYRQSMHPVIPELPKPALSKPRPKSIIGTLALVSTALVPLPTRLSIPVATTTLPLRLPAPRMTSADYAALSAILLQQNIRLS